jgi:hypothetical protein
MARQYQYQRLTTPEQRAGSWAVGSRVPRRPERMKIGGSNMDERTPEAEADETRDSEPEANDLAAGSAAEQAKKREREMEESGEENAG